MCFLDKCVRGQDSSAASGDQCFLEMREAMNISLLNYKLKAIPHYHYGKVISGLWLPANLIFVLFGCQKVCQQ